MVRPRPPPGACRWRSNPGAGYTVAIARPVMIPAPIIPATAKLQQANRIADNHMMRPLQLAACLAFAALPFAAVSQEPATAPSDGSVEQGRMLAYTCMGCHGIPEYRNAYPAYRV